RRASSLNRSVSTPRCSGRSISAAEKPRSTQSAGTRATALNASASPPASTPAAACRRPPLDGIGQLHPQELRVSAVVEGAVVEEALARGAGGRTHTEAV